MRYCENFIRLFLKETPAYNLLAKCQTVIAFAAAV